MNSELKRRCGKIAALIIDLNTRSLSTGITNTTLLPAIETMDKEGFCKMQGVIILKTLYY